MAAAEFPYALGVEGQWGPYNSNIKNKLTIYFQSAKKSDGGVCEVEYGASDGQTATVRFKTDEVRQRVLNRKMHELAIGKSTVKLSLRLPESESPAPGEMASSDSTVTADVTEEEEEKVKEKAKPPKEEEESAPKSAIIENIQDFSAEFLTMLVEIVLKGSSDKAPDFSIEMIPESNCAVVSFSTRKDTEDFILSSLGHTMIKKKNMKVRPLEKTSKVKAEGLPPNTNPDVIMYYFERFGDLEDDCVVVETEESAIITFKNPEDAQKVIKQPHHLRTHPFRVLPYYEYLQTALYGKDRPTLRLPEPFTEKMDRSLWQHLKKDQKSHNSVKQAMSVFFCEMDLQSSEVTITPSPSLLHQGEQTRKLIKSWRENSLSRLAELMAQYKSIELHIQKDAWTDLQPEVKRVSGDAVTLVPYVDEGTIAVAGPKEEVNRIEGLLKETVQRVTQKIQREKGSESNEITMTPSIYNLVLCQGLEKQTLEKFPEMDMTYLSHSQKLSLYGLKDEVLETANKIYEGTINLTRKPAELHQSVLDFLLKKDLEEMTKDLFFSKKVNVAFESVGTRVSLVGITEEDVNEGEKVLQSNLSHLSFKVEDPSVLKTSDWKDLVSQIKNKVTTVAVQMSANEVVVSGFVDSIKGVKQTLHDFVEENSHIEKTLKAHKTVVAFIKDHKTQDWSEDVKFKVNVNFKEDTIGISGPRLHVSDCESLFNDLVTSTHHQTLKIVKPGAKKFFLEKEMICVSCAKTNFNCLVELMDDLDHLRPTVKPQKRKSVYEYKTRDGLEISVHKADMCSFQVDAVVGSCNPNLVLDGGLAKALSDAAGPKLQDDCNNYLKRRQLSTGDGLLLDAGGRLQCKHIIFVVGPHYNSQKPQDSEKLLKKAVKRSLNLADQESLESLAIPAISSANFGFPLATCAQTIVKAIKEFCDFGEGDFTLKKIYLVDNNDTTIQALEDAVKKVFGAKSAPGSQLVPIPVARKPQKTTFFQGASQSFQTKEGLTITLMKGNIENTTMDVVVNTLSSDLNLSVGAISNALLNAAGPQLQVLLNQQGTGPANPGAIFETAGADLKNKLVFHAVVPHWNQQQGQKVLEDIMDNCLSKAEQRQQSSIVFSAIGTGNLAFPKPLVASSMLDAVFQFSSKRGSKHVQEVVFALHPKDSQTIQVFTDEFSNRFLAKSSSSNMASQSQTTGPFSKVTTKSGVHETTVGGITLQVLNGDITAEKTDVIVNSTNTQFTLTAGVSKAILDKAGPAVEAECKNFGANAVGGLLMTQAGNLQCKNIIHIAAQSNVIVIQKHVRKALEMCAKKNLTSIAIPAIGTGQAGLSPSQVADSMMDGITDFLTKTPQSSLKLIKLVVFQAPMLPDFHKSMQSRETAPAATQEKDSAWSRIKASVTSFFTGSWGIDVKQRGGMNFAIEGMEIDPVFFSVCGPTQAAVCKTKDFLEEMINKETDSCPIIDPAILILNDQDQQQIQHLQITEEVSIKFEYTANAASKDSPGEAKLIVEGLTRDVLKASHKIHEMLKTVKENENLRKEMDLVKELAEWQYEEGGQYKKFDDRTNLDLENAFAGKVPTVSITFKTQTYLVKMPDGPAISNSGRDQMNIQRIDKLKVKDSSSTPQSWDAMAPNELYKKFNLPQTNTEYQDVLKRFKASCPNNNVVKIERVQNPGMWKNYENNKNVMEIKNKHINNEKKLFHGTSEQTLGHIEKNGFNRSYAGKNAAAYGNGTYFALNASYSSNNTYSVPNAQGQKHMYLCRVLAGDYTKGQAGMIVPPPKPNTLDHYDTVVDNPNAPTIFVVMRDDHAYPEYLITFT